MPWRMARLQCCVLVEERGAFMEDVEIACGRRLTQAREAIARAARDCGRAPDSITLIAVSKTFAASEIRPVIDAGHRVFGENRVQEAKAKWLDIKGDAIELHLV